MNTSALVVDDSALARKVVGDALEAIQGVTVVGRASNGRIALEQIQGFRPDLVTLDLEMPDMDGVQVMQSLRDAAYRPKVVIVTANSRRAPDLARRALALGALDIVAKPTAGGEDMDSFRTALRIMVEGLSHSTEEAPDLTVRIEPAAARCARPWKVSVVCIGVSTGGPTALAAVIPKLPGDLPVPVLIVQHMPAGFTSGLVRGLDEQSALHVVEAEEGMIVKAGTVYLAPGGSHMGVQRRPDGVRVYLSDAAPENHCRPAADFLFRTVEATYSGNVLGVIMTGMGTDGAAGLKALRTSGAYVLSQDAASCKVYGMPKAALEAGAVDEVVPLSRLAQTMTEKVRRSQ